MAPPRSALRAPPRQGGDTSGPAEPVPRCPPIGEPHAPTEQPRRWVDADGEHIDVRGLAPPQPLVAILQLVESLGRRGAVIVHHDREPVLLYPELAERAWHADALPAPPGELRLRLVPDDDDND